MKNIHPLLYCRALEELLINFNQITQLPDAIGLCLTNLHLLSIHSNKISFLPPTTSRLRHLLRLDAHLNSLLTLPKDLHLLPSLHTLDVGRNFHHLISLPDSIGLLPSLSSLDISYNGITALPDSLACAAGLRSLKAEGNPLVSPPAKVVEGGVDGVREYLIGRMNGEGVQGRKGWMWRMARCGMVEGGRMGREDDGFGAAGRRWVEVLSSPLREGSGRRRRTAPPWK